MPATLPGDDPPLGRRAGPRPEAARGHDRGRRSAGCSTRCTSTTPTTTPPAPTTATWPPGSPATRWPSRCSGTPPRRSTSTSESAETKALYGLDDDEDRATSAAAACWPAGWSSAGVRFVQLYAGGAHNDNNWDAHGDLAKNHNYHAGRTDKPIAGLLKDLKRRGLLDETLVDLGRRVRPPADRRVRQGDRPRPQRLRLHDVDGRRRHQGRASASARPTSSARPPSPTGSTSRTCTPPSSASSASTPNRLTYFYSGLDQKLVGVEGAEPIQQVMA